MKNKFKRFLSLFLAVLMVLTTVNVTVYAAESSVEVSTLKALKDAVADGSDVLLTNDITVDTAMTVPDDVKIDLNGKTLYLNVENSYYNNVEITNGNVVIGKDDVHTCDGYFLVNPGKTLTLSDVKLTSSEDGYKGYTIFHLKEAADLVLTNSAINVANNEYAGSIVYAGNANSDVTITDSVITAENMGRGFIFGNITLTDSKVTLTSTTENGMEHGFNRSTLTVNNSDITISGGTGRGITAETGDITITGDSNVVIYDMGEATIELRSGKNLTIEETATVKVDAEVNKSNGTVTGTVSKYMAAELPTASVTEIENEDLTFALNFVADEATEEQLEAYGDWYADFELTINKDVTFNANGGADGFLSGQYDEWSENWVSVPFEDVTLKANESLKIMEYAAEMLNREGLKVTYNDVVTAVKDFDCGVFFEPEFLAENPDLEVTLELRMYNPVDETETYTIGKTYVFRTVELPTASVTEIENKDLTFALNFVADEATEAQLEVYGDWYADFELTINKDVTFNANGGADGFLSGQYDEWSENWVSVPFEDVTLKANESLKIMEYAAEMLNKQGLKVTYNDVVTAVKDFDCGVFFTEEFLEANPDLVVTLELRMYNPENAIESYTIGDTYVYTLADANAELPTASVTEIENEDLTFALNFLADPATAAQLAVYGDWFADFELTVNKDVTFNANGGADGYLSGQYDEWSENWVNVPFEDVTLKADEALKIMEYAAELMNKPGLKYTYGEVYEFVNDFDCGVFFTDEFLAANPDLKVTLELRMYNPENESESYTIGETYVFTLDDVEKGLSGEGTEESPFLIKTLEDLIFFRDSVNAGETTYNAEGVYVALDGDIDMSSVDWSVNIGDDCNATFDGIFDGKGHVISNLNSKETAAKADGYVCTGLFGAIAGNAVIKNLTIENVSIDAGYLGNNAAAVVGIALYGTGTIENVDVIGDVKINAPNVTAVGAIVGYAYGGALTIKDCEVIANEGSAVTGAAYVGGIIGYAGGTPTVTGSTVDGADITGTSCAAAGIAGIALGGKITDNTVKNADVTTGHKNWQNSAAIAVGTITKTTEVSVTYENVTVNGEAADTVVGSEHKEHPENPVAKVEARIGNMYYLTLEAAMKAAKAGDTVTVLADVDLEEAITIEKDLAVTLDLNGYTVSQSKECTAHYAMITNKGSLTITDSSADADGKISFKDTGAGDASFGWGSYTIYNQGTLVVENGTIENLSEQNAAGNGAVHMYSAISQYSGSTTINGGKLSVPTYRTVRVNGGDLEVNGGEFEGQIWMQPFNNETSITITGGTFAPKNLDASAVYVDNASKTVEMSVTGGKFNGKIGSANPEALGGPISGGSFSETAKNGTNEALLAEGYAFKATGDGRYGVEEAPETEEPVVRNERTKKTYSDVLEGLMAAMDGDTVTLLKAVTVDYTLVPVGITFDLNGNALTSRYFACYGNTVDNSDKNEGLLVAAKEYILIQKNNKHLPVKDGDGYRFYEVAKINYSVKEENTKFSFKAYVENEGNKVLAENGKAAGVSVNVLLSWNAAEGVRTQKFEYPDTMMKAYFKGYNSSTDTYQSALTFKLTGADTYGISYSAVLVSELGVEIVSQ